MKLYRQGTCEIRIRLTDEDLKAFEITAQELDYDSPKGKQVILELVELAKEKLGFETAGEKIYIQLYPAKSGACDLFITKLDREASVVCFRFSDFDSFFAAVSQARPADRRELWQEKKSGRFYVFTTRREIPPLFSEFGERVKIPSRIFLRSRCRKLRWEERN